MAKVYTQEELDDILGNTVSEEQEGPPEFLDVDSFLDEIERPPKGPPEFLDVYSLLDEIERPSDEDQSSAADSFLKDSNVRPLSARLLQTAGAQFGRALNIVGSPITAADELATGGDTPLIDIFSGKGGPFNSEPTPKEEILPGEEGFFTAADLGSDALRDTMLLTAASPYLAYQLVSKIPGSISAVTGFRRARDIGIIGRELKTSSEIATSAKNLQNESKAALLNVPAVGSIVGRSRTQVMNFLRRAGNFVEDIPVVALRSSVEKPASSAALELNSVASGTFTGLSATALGSNDKGDSTEFLGILGTIVGSVANAGTLVSFARSKSNIVSKLIREFNTEADKVRAVHVLDGWLSDINSDITERGLARGLSQEEIDKQLLPSIAQTKELFDHSLSALREAFPDLAGINQLPPGIIISSGSRVRGLEGEALAGADRISEALSTSARAVGRQTGGKLASDFQKATKDKLSSFQESAFKLAEELSQSGDPLDLSLANNIRAEAMQEFLQSRIMSAQGRIAGVVTGIAPDDVILGADSVINNANLTARAEEAGVNIGRILDDALHEIKQVESIMFSNGATGAEVGEESLGFIREAVDNIRTQIGDETFNSLPGIGDILGFLRQGVSVTDTQLVNTRTILGEGITALSSGPRKSSVRVRQLMFLQDVIDDALGGVSAELAVARQWKQVSNDTFVRSFTGELLEKNNRGVDKIRAEDIVFKAFNFSGSDRTPFRIREIESSAAMGDISRRFLEDGVDQVGIARDQASALELLDNFSGEYKDFRQFVSEVLGYDTPLADAVNNESRIAVRSIMSRFVTETGELDSTKFSSFVSNNPSILRDYPDIREMVSDVRGAQLYYDKVVARSQGIDKLASKQAAYGTVLGINDPVVELSSMLGRGITERDFRALATPAKRAAERALNNKPGGVAGAVEGMEAALVQASLSAASRNGKFSWRAFNDVMFSPNLKSSSGKGASSLESLMIKYGVSDADRMARLKGLTDIAMRTEADLINPEMVLALSQNQTDQLSMWQNLAAGGIGSVLATKTASSLGLLSSGSSGPSLVIASGGAKIMRHFTSEQLDESVYRAMMMGLSSADGFNTMTRLTFSSNQERLAKWNAMIVEAGLEYLSPAYASEESLDKVLADLDARLEEIQASANQNVIPETLDELPEIPEIETEDDFFNQLQ